MDKDIKAELEVNNLPIQLTSFAEQFLAPTVSGEKAQRENKPIFLSIGYSTCHWCHVMAHESFEHPEVARLMNEAFVSIKVDREERPDIDNVYMTACQAMTGSGGWPLSIIMTPDKKPFFAATYIPREGRFGLIGVLKLILTSGSFGQHGEAQRPLDTVEAERCAVRGYTNICNLTAGKDHRTYDLAMSILHEEVEHESWFSEFLGEGPSGHFLHRSETSPFVSKFLR